MDISEKILISKAYFDKGYGLTNYFFKLVAVFGLTTGFAKATFIVLFFYTGLCYVLGRFWFNTGLLDTENEIQNRFNPFQKEVRKALKEKLK